jgi:hypothetical protein
MNGKVKVQFKDPYLNNSPPNPFTRWDYLLCIVAFLLLAVASVPQIASVLAGPR